MLGKKLLDELAVLRAAETRAAMAVAWITMRFTAAPAFFSASASSLLLPGGTVLSWPLVRYPHPANSYTTNLVSTTHSTQDFAYFSPIDAIPGLACNTEGVGVNYKHVGFQAVSPSF